MSNNELKNHLMPSLSKLDIRMIEHIPPGGNWTSIPEDIPSKRLEQIREMAKERGMVRTTYYGRLRCDQPAYTISTYFNRPGNGTNIHPWENRTLSSREAARLQSFPDDFIFYGNDSKERTQIGNAVPPLVGYAIGKAIEKKLKKKVSYGDLFAGAGGLSFGLSMAGLKCISALELDKDAAETYKRNHVTAEEIVVGDIREASNQELFCDAVRKNVTDEPWVLVGGPPCQGFSTAGYRDENDERNKLVDSYIDIVKKLEPSIVVMENVPGILSMKGGKVLQGVYEALTKLGYVLPESPWIINAEQYGVPQMRKRVIVVAAKNYDMLPDYPDPVFNKCLGRRETEEDRMCLFGQYPYTAGEALIGMPSLCEVKEEYMPKTEMNRTYDRWCKGQITVEELLKGRSGD